MAETLNPEALRAATAAYHKSMGNLMGHANAIEATIRAYLSVSAAESRVQSLEEEVKRLREALTPSGETKASYIGEFQFTVTAMALDESDEPYESQEVVTVPWTTIKEIMVAIRSRAALSGDKP